MASGAWGPEPRSERAASHRSARGLAFAPIAVKPWGLYHHRDADDDHDDVDDDR